MREIKEEDVPGLEEFTTLLVLDDSVAAAFTKQNDGLWYFNTMTPDEYPFEQQSRVRALDPGSMLDLIEELVESPSFFAICDKDFVALMEEKDEFSDIQFSDEAKGLVAYHDAELQRHLAERDRWAARALELPRSSDGGGIG